MIGVLIIAYVLGVVLVLGFCRGAHTDEDALSASWLAVLEAELTKHWDKP